MTMNYAEHFNEVIGVSYADLLERIQTQFGDVKFTLSSKALKRIRMRRWQELATPAKVSLTTEIHEALEKMANEADPCIEILDGSNKVGANSELRLIKLPLQQGTDALKSLTKEKLLDTLEARGRENAELHAKNLELEKRNQALVEQVDIWKAKAGVDTIKEESFDDFPESYKSLQFPELIPDFIPGKRRRPYYRSAEMWKPIAHHLGWIDTWQCQEHLRRQSKHTAESRADEEAGLAPKKSSNRGAESRCAISHFFKFVKLTLGPAKNFIPKQEHLLSVITVDAFLSFYRMRVGSVSTVSNVAKMLVSLYKYMKTMEKFHRYNARIKSLIAVCRRFIQLMDEVYARDRARRLLDNYLLLRGEWLKPEELAQLTSKICEKIVHFLNDTDTVEKREALSKAEVYEFEMLMILYSYLQLGGQRREVVASFMVGNFASIDNKVIYFTLLEKVQKRNSDRLPLPTTLGQLIRIWVDKYRPLLLKDGVELKCCWVNQRGAPMSFRCITQGVISKIASIFPHRTIGPLVLRRLFVSLMYKISLERPEEYENWPSLHAPYINTSSTMLETCYNRTNGHKQAEKTGRKINSGLNLEPTPAMTDAVEEHLQDVNFLDVTNQDPVVQVIADRILGPKTEYLCLFESGKQQWVPDVQLDHLCDKVLEYFNSFGGEVQEREVEPVEEEDEEQEPVDEADMPALDSDSSVDEVMQEASSHESECQDTSVTNPSVAVEDSSSLFEAVPVSTCKGSRKRKRSAIDDVAEVYLGDRAIKPGDVVSVNPHNSKDEFWLAQVIGFTNKRQLKIQWLERKGKSWRYELGHEDHVIVQALNGFAEGVWQNPKCYSIE